MFSTSIKQNSNKLLTILNDSMLQNSHNFFKGNNYSNQQTMKVANPVSYTHLTLPTNREV